VIGGARLSTRTASLVSVYAGKRNSIMTATWRQLHAAALPTVKAGISNTGDSL
jgi:hypothetical protein